MPRRTILLALAAAIGATAPASAAHATGPTAQEQDRAGLRVTWPVTDDPVRLMSGVKVAVTVRPRADRAPRAVVSLVRLTASGRPRTAATRRAVRSGTVTFRLGFRGPYRLSLRAGGRFWRTTIDVSPARRLDVTQVAAARKAPAARPLPVTESCAGTRPAVTTSVSPTSTVPGGQLEISIVNTGDTWITTGAHFGLERLETTAGWVPVGLPYAFTAGAISFGCGATYTLRPTLPADIAPGHYRILPGTPGAAPVEFDVVGAS